MFSIHPGVALSNSKCHTQSRPFVPSDAQNLVHIEIHSTPHGSTLHSCRGSHLGQIFCRRSRRRRPLHLLRGPGLIAESLRRRRLLQFLTHPRTPSCPRNSRGSAAKDYSVAAFLSDLPSRSAEMMADTLLAALGRAQGGPQERLDWLLL